MPTRYDERNCHSVCEECNCYDTGHHGRFAEAMRKKYGTEEVMSLMKKSKGLQKFFRFELEDLIEFYKSENRQSKKDFMKEGDEVVCIWRGQWKSNKGRIPTWPMPKFNEVVTVTETLMVNGVPAVLVLEYPLPCGDCFRADRFAPICLRFCARKRTRFNI